MGKKSNNNEEAKKLLSDCKPEESFWVNNGPVLHNLHELSLALKSLSDEQFSHHLNTEKNDFSKWVNDVIGDIHLAKTLSKAKSKTAAIKKVNERLETLKKTAS